MANSTPSTKCARTSEIRTAERWDGPAEHPTIQTTRPLQPGDRIIKDQAGNVLEVLSEAEFGARYTVIS